MATRYIRRVCGVMPCGTEFWLRGLTAQLPKTEFEILQTGGDGAGLARGFGF